MEWVKVSNREFKMQVLKYILIVYITDQGYEFEIMDMLNGNYNTIYLKAINMPEAQKEAVKIFRDYLIQHKKVIEDVLDELKRNLI
jgi:hypothetical protein